MLYECPPAFLLNNAFLVPFYLGVQIGRNNLKSVFKRQTVQPGKSFLYNDANSYVLGMITEEIFDKKQGDLISEFIWRKIGAEANAKILTTKSGQHLVSANILARPTRLLEARPFDFRRR